MSSKRCSVGQVLSSPQIVVNLCYNLRARALRVLPDKHPVCPCAVVVYVPADHHISERQLVVEVLKRAHTTYGRTIRGSSSCPRRSSAV